MAGALEGIRVVDHSSVVMGPLAAQILGDMGADVIKVEHGKGDTNRHMGGGPLPGLSGIAMTVNRNKRSVSLDLKSPAGRDAFLRILGTADVLVTNVRPKAMRGLMLAYDDIATQFPRLVYCQAQGFRAGTPDEDRPAYDDIIQAATGMANFAQATTGHTSFVPSIIADKVSGMTIVQAVLAALLHRERTGLGQRVEVPMFDAVLAFNLAENLSRAVIPGQPSGYNRILMSTRGPHRTADGHVAIMPYEEKHWKAIFDHIGRSAELEEPWFADRARRTENAEYTYGRLAEVIATRSTSEWLQFAAENDVPVNAVPHLDEVIAEESLHRGMIVEREHPQAGPYRSVRPAIIMDGSPLTVRRDAPVVGEHTREILAEAGFGAEEIESMLSSGVAVQA